METAIANLKRQHDNDANELKKFEKLSAKCAENFAEYSKQRLENEMVLKELALLGEDCAVFKRIGPCLVKQDTIEAKSNVEKRVEYITDELRRIEDQKKALDDKRKSRTQSLQKVQEQLQSILHSQAQHGDS